MNVTLLRTDKVSVIEDIYRRNADSTYRLCYSFMRNKADAEDAVQETYIKLIKSNMHFDSHEHEKAWLIVTAANVCKDTLKRKHRKDENIDEHIELESKNQDDSPSDILNAVLKLPDNFKTAVFMYYYEGYSTKEIAAILHKPSSTVRNMLSRARKQLKAMLGDEFDEQ